MFYKHESPGSSPSFRTSIPGLAPIAGRNASSSEVNNKYNFGIKGLNSFLFFLNNKVYSIWIVYIDLMKKLYILMGVDFIYSIFFKK